MSRGEHGRGGEPIYDRIGDGYDLSRRPDPRIAERLLCHLEPRNGGRFLDLGCGTGNYTVLLAASGLSMVGLDTSETMLAEARRKAPEVTWRQGDAGRLPFPEAAFDGVLCTLVVHHLGVPGAWCGEVARVLVPGGRLVLFTSSPEQIRRYWLARYFPAAIEAAAEQMPTVDALLSSLQGAGLSPRAIEPWEVPLDAVDLFLYSGKHRPELYLDPRVRAGISTFADLASEREMAEGLGRLEEDIASGRIEGVVAAEGGGSDGDYLFLTVARAG